MIGEPATDTRTWPHPELDRGSYLAHYGLTAPWTLWLLRQLPELAALTPSELRRPLRRPPCPQCGQPMAWRPEKWVCYQHYEPVTLPQKARIGPPPKWPGNPDLLSMVGQDIDCAWDPDQDGYVITRMQE